MVAVSVGGVRLDTLPEELSPDASITLIVSSGLKDANVLLEWPATSLMIDVQVNVNGKINNELVQKFAGGITPAYTTEKLSFTLTDHPSDQPYLFVVEVRESGTNNRFQMYAKLQIVPVTGEVIVEEIHSYLPGLTAEMVTLPSYPFEGTSAETVRFDLENLGLVVTEEYEASDMYVDGVVLRLESNGQVLQSGAQLEKGSAIVMYVSKDEEGGSILESLFGW